MTRKRVVRMTTLAAPQAKQEGMGRNFWVARRNGVGGRRETLHEEEEDRRTSGRNSRTTTIETVIVTVDHEDGNRFGVHIYIYIP
mmetsp:Transcript_18560/g.40052  ORF Transcript_18560/g.40052 Transcript_18560/m.40052 type:complete len:85 (+) Transcript_18560:187-441(+)